MSCPSAKSIELIPRYLGSPKVSRKDGHYILSGIRLQQYAYMYIRMYLCTYVSMSYIYIYTYIYIYIDIRVYVSLSLCDIIHVNM